MFKDLADATSLSVTESAADFTCLLSAINAAPNASGIINAGNVMHCLAVADKYDVPFLTEACDSYLLGEVALEIATLPNWMATASRFK